MKKYIFLSTLLFSLIKAEAQVENNDFNSYFSGGPRIGVNFSNLNGADDAETKTGLQAGAFLIYSFQEHFGVGLDALYSMEGAEYTETSVTGNLTIKNKVESRLNYLRLPLQAIVFFGDHGNAVRPKISLGPDLGLLLSAKNEYTTTTEDGNNNITTVSSESDSKSNLNGLDFGAIAGAGFNYRLAEYTWLNTDVRYYLGASDIREKAPANSDDLKNTNISVSIGLAIGF